MGIDDLADRGAYRDQSDCVIVWLYRQRVVAGELWGSDPVVTEMRIA
jgi:hypothetical protein